MKVGREAKRILAVGVLAVLAASFLAPAEPAHAFAPVNCGPSGGSGQQTGLTISSGGTSNNAGPFAMPSGCGTLGNEIIATVTYTVPNSGAFLSPLTLTDNNSDVFTAGSSVASYWCTTTTGTRGSMCVTGHIQQVEMVMFSASLAATVLGHLLFTVHYGSAPYNSLGQLAFVMIPGGTGQLVNSCANLFSNLSNGTLIVGGTYSSTCSVSVPAGDYAVSVEEYSFYGPATFTHPGTTTITPTTQGTAFGTSFCPGTSGPNLCYTQMGVYSNPSGVATVLNSGYSCTSNCASGANSFGNLVIVFSSVATISGSTTTTVVNTACLGACSGGNNGTANYLTRATLYFYASQSQASSGLVDNVTLKVAAVHMTTTQTSLYITVYSVSGVPSGGNQYVLTTGGGVTVVPITNGTSAFFVHVNPQAQICASCYYAVGFMTNSTASRGSGASGSGISVYETSQVGVTEYKFATGQSTPPTTFYSNTVKTPNDFLFIHLTFTVASITVTSTKTIGGTATATITTVSTQVINQGDPTKAGFWYIPMFYLLTFAAVFIGSYGIVNAATSRRGP